MTASIDTLAKASRARTDRVVRLIGTAMATIEKEIAEADGIYPYNSGRLSVAEVCRRAGVHQVTLQSAKHKGTTRITVLAWLDRVKLAMIRGAKTVRREVHRRATQWKDLYQTVAAQYKNMYSIEVVQRDALIKELKQQNKLLRSQLAQARASGGKVIGIRSRKK